MAKVNITAIAFLQLNTEKAGGWLARFKVVTPVPNGTGGFVNEEYIETTAWKNASAGKRWIKSMVQAHTPRKSIKLEVVGKDLATDKPTALSGELTYKK
jgi:hypothetical protein